MVIRDSAAMCTSETHGAPDDIEHKSDDDEFGPMATSLFRGKWATIKQKVILSRMPKHAQPQKAIGEKKSYTLEAEGKKTRIQVVLDKPLYYVKGANLDVVQRLSKSFGTKFKMDKSGGVGIACRENAYGAFAQAMALAEWKIEDLETS